VIPNAGLDNIAAYSPWQSLSGSTNDNSGSQWLAYAAISEDSSTPSPSDTNIGSEAMRTNSTGGFSRSATAIRDPDANRLGVSIERAYVFEIDGNYNITKYGYVPLSVGGNFSWIDLTRADPDDPGSTPVTLTLVPGDQLQLWQTLTITVPWSVDLEQFVITGTVGNDGVGTHDAYCGFYASGDSISESNPNDNSIATLIKYLFWPTQNRGCYAIAGTPNATRDAAIGSATGGSSGSNSTLATYTSGTYYRDKVFKFTTAQGNITMTGINLQAGGTNVSGYGFKIVFDDPATFEKDNLHTLTLTFRVSWAEG
jgi:hypothetical protein